MQLATSRLEITYLRTTSVKPDPRNPRVHSDKQIRQIAQSIESFGFNVPLLIDDEQKVSRCNAFVTPITRRPIALSVRPGAKCSLTYATLSPVCSGGAAARWVDGFRLARSSSTVRERRGGSFDPVRH
jgi:hypothetical protein